MNKEYKFIWQHCKNPFLFKKDYGQTVLLSTDNLDEALPELPEEEISADSEDHEMVGGMIYTPLGVLPITEHTDMFKLFNFWMCHTNFNISRNVFNIVCKTQGVEAAHVFSRYRFRIAIGKAFDFKPTRIKIQDSIKKYLESRQNKTE